MSILDDLADALARDTIAAAEHLGDEELIAEVSRVIGAASTTTQEAFMTAIRVRLSERRARRYLEMRLAKGPKAGAGAVDLGAKRVLDTPEGQ